MQMKKKEYHGGGGCLTGIKIKDAFDRKHPLFIFDV